MQLSRSFFGGVLLLSLCASPSQAQTATVNWNNVDQVIDGFGAATALRRRRQPSSSRLVLVT